MMNDQRWFQPRGLSKPIERTVRNSSAECARCTSNSFMTDRSRDGSWTDAGRSCTLMSAHHELYANAFQMSSERSRAPIRRFMGERP